MNTNGYSCDGNFDRPRSCPADSTGGNTSLDPSDWHIFHDLCSTELDGLIDHLATVAERPVWRPIPATVRHKLAEALPIEPQGARQVCDEIKELILPYTLGNTHPRFFGWVHGTGTTGGILAELYAAAMNANLGGREHAPVHVERTVIEWCRQIFSFPESASGLLLSGTSMANLVALAVARNHHFPTDVREEGVAAAPAALIAYTSTESHCSVAKAIELLGLGRRNLRRVPVDCEFQIDLAALEKTVAADRAAGLQPFCVVGTAGTVNTAAIDDLDALASFCQREKLWFHVDGAFGAMAILSSDGRSKLEGIQRADSLAFDFHKWLHVPYDAGCVLVRDGVAHRRTFATQADYLADGRGAAAGAPWYCEYGPELSRGFRALKVWFTIKDHGLRRLGEAIAENCRQARLLGQLVDAHPQLERLAPVSLNIVCFRSVQPRLSPKELDRLNAELVIAVQESGIAVPSTTQINGKTSIRVNITNHRTRDSDLQLLINAIDESAAVVAARIAPSFHQRATRSELHAAKAIESACSRTELLPLLTGVTVTHDPQLLLPFTVDAAGGVRLGNQAVQDQATCAILVRHAVELVALERLADDHSPVSEICISMFACRTAAIAASDLPEGDGIPEFLDEAYAACSRGLIGRPSTEMVQQLLALQGVDPAVIDDLTPADWHTIAQKLRESESIAGPTERLLTTGGDTRLEIDPQTGQSRYGCLPHPVPELASFGSCTATTVTRQNFAVAEQMRQRFLAAAMRGEFRKQFDLEIEQLKRQILEFGNTFKLPGAEVMLCSSGTDAELYAVCLLKGSSAEKLTNVVIAPDETGTGVPEAAAGRHFSTRTPLDIVVKKGELLRGCNAEDIDVITIGARDSSGALRSAEQIDHEAELAVETAIENGMCLLHILDVSKTGWGAPCLPLVRKLAARHPDRLTVVVDACQLRLDWSAVGGYLSEGFLVQLTGSKSFGGPAFSGALLVPPRASERFSRLGTLPVGLTDYAARAEWPADWAITRQLAEYCNTGLVLRWAAAIREMQTFDAIPNAWRAQILRDLCDCVQSAMNDIPGIVALPTRVPDRCQLSPADSWDHVPTIFPFSVQHREDWLGGAFLTHDEMKTLHCRLNADLSMIPGLQTSDADAVLAAFVCHIGQPVELCKTPGNRISALRFCTGASVVSRIRFDASLGRNWEERLEFERRRIRRAFEKIGLILDHWDEIDRSEATGRNRLESNNEAMLTVR